MRALLVDDQPKRPQVEGIRRILRRNHIELEAGYDFARRQWTPTEFLNQLSELQVPPDVCIIDYRLSWKHAEGSLWDGDRVAKELRERWPFVYILFISAVLQELDSPYKRLSEILRIPYTGYLELSGDWEHVFGAQLRCACDLVEAEKFRGVSEAIEALGGLEGLAEALGEFKGRAFSVVEMAGIVRKVRGTDATVLITGETGTGKELVAQVIHNGSARATGAFVAINCADLDHSLVDSELWGVKKKTATGVDERKGAFEEANGGTLLLDEIGELPLGQQAKLLRVLQENEIVPLGAAKSKPIPIDVRIIAATKRDLEQEVREDRFRDDLYYRLNVIHIKLPPLRERTGDLEILAEHFLEGSRVKHGCGRKRLSKEAWRVMKEYAWPGNVRELANAIEQGVILSEGDDIRPEHLPPRITVPQSEQDQQVIDMYGENWIDAKREFEKRYWIRRLREAGGIIAEAARRGRVSRRHLIRRYKALGIDPHNLPDVAH